MAYAKIEDSVIVQTFRRLPNGARRLDDGSWITPLMGKWSGEQRERCGLVEIVDGPIPEHDAMTTRLVKSVELVDGTPTSVWLEVELTSEEIADVESAERGRVARSVNRERVESLRAFAAIGRPSDEETRQTIQVIARVLVHLSEEFLGGE